jgi:hydantoinase/carbamoylase family amidase
VAWTDSWVRARLYVAERLKGIATATEDAAGNRWYTIAGERPDTIVIGSHVDSVPDGGRLDGTLGVLAGVAILRAAGGDLPLTLRLVDWADEEGARFGRSCFGSGCASGSLHPDAVRQLRDAAGITLPDALAAHGVDLDTAPDATRELASARAYLELHIEQGSRLESRGESVGVVTGCVGVERHRYVFSGRAAHAGSTPMDARADAFLAAAATALEVRALATRHGGVGTVGPVRVHPGVPTIINEHAEIVVDLRHEDPDELEAMHAGVQAASRTDPTVVPSSDLVLRIAPVPFDPNLLLLAERACLSVSGAAQRMTSGALHDATETARRVPTALLFAQSIGGVSHNPDEDTRPHDVRVAVRALADLTSRVAADLARAT